MNNLEGKSKDFEELVYRINNGLFPADYEHFGGANLIITNEPDRNFHDGDIVVFTIHAGALSWLVEQLANIKGNQIDYFNKYEFYPRIGELLNEELKTNEDIIDVMLSVVNTINHEW